MEKLKNCLNKLNKPRILDIATGKGSFIELLMHLTEDFSEIIGIDNSKKTIRIMRHIKTELIC